MITNWIVLISTWKELLKDGLDGTSRYFGGQEINQTKVETILWDTLYWSLKHLSMFLFKDKEIEYWNRTQKAQEIFIQGGTNVLMDGDTTFLGWEGRP